MGGAAMEQMLAEEPGLTLRWPDQQRTGNAQQMHRSVGAT